MSKFRVNSLPIVYHCAIHNLPTFRKVWLRYLIKNVESKMVQQFVRVLREFVDIWRSELKARM